MTIITAGKLERHDYRVEPRHPNTPEPGQSVDTRLGPDEPEQGDDYGVATRTQDPELKQPPLYRVILLNDDYTPMEFVVHILENFFYMSREKATQVMLAVHTQGKGVCGVYTRDIAETKAAMVNQYSRDNEHPLVCEVEKADDQ